MSVLLLPSVCITIRVLWPVVLLRQVSFSPGCLAVAFSTQCTERILPPAPALLFIHGENRAPTRGDIVARHSNGISFDKGRLVHDSDVFSCVSLSEAQMV